MGTKLVKIDTKDHTHAAYDGRNKVQSAQFTRCLDAGEVEVFRTHPKGFLENIGFIDPIEPSAA